VFAFVVARFAPGHIGKPISIQFRKPAAIWFVKFVDSLIQCFEVSAAHLRFPGARMHSHLGSSNTQLDRDARMTNFDKQLMILREDTHWAKHIQTCEEMWHEELALPSGERIVNHQLSFATVGEWVSFILFHGRKLAELKFSAIDLVDLPSCLLSRP
jgi:hypothetical protein